MKISPGFVDLLCVSLLLYMTLASLSAENGSTERETPDISLPKSQETETNPGSGGVSGEVFITAKREGEKVAFFLGKERIAGLTSLEKKLKGALPSRAIIRVDEDLPVEVVVRLLIVASRARVPASLAYDPEKLKKEG